MMSLLENLPRTRLKIFLAQLLYKIVRTFTRSPFVVVRRGGIRYALDLSEGIDLSIFLFGGFQQHVYANPRLACITGPATIIDVGANMGCMSLLLAQRFPSARIHAFEPTGYAWAKFRRNLELNPDLAGRILPVQQFVSDAAAPAPDIKAYASWKVDGSRCGQRHPVHLGTVQTAEGVPAVTLDAYCAAKQISNVALIKIDTDGHELKVLHGARTVIGMQRPLVIFEIGGYVLTEQGITFDDYLAYFQGLNYDLYDCVTNKAILDTNWRSLIPRYGTVDLLAVPRESV